MTGGNTPRRAALHCLARAYAWSLCLYPARFRREFGDEMAGVFRQALVEAEEAGMGSALGLAWRELRDWIPALVRCHLANGKESMMAEILDTSRRDRPAPWPGLLMGILPFVLLGPIAVLLAYPSPAPPWRSAPLTLALISLVYYGPLLLGVILGWTRRWPAWAYPYLGPMFVIPGVLAANEITALMSSIGAWAIWLSGPLVLAVFGLMIVALLLASRRWGAIRTIADGVRHDWTRLSFSLFLLAAFVFGGIDHDEDPNLTAFVILPTLVVVAAAIIYLRSPTQAMRALALMAGLCLAIAIRLAGGAFFYLIYGVVLIGIVFLPGFLQLAGLDRSSTRPT
jgi:hypothetical protein